MKYLVFSTDEHPPFYTNYFDPELHFDHKGGMVIFDLINHTYTKDGVTWEDIEDDHL